MATGADGARPRALLRPWDGLALMVGMVIGIGIFKVPSLVALKLDDPLLILGLWVAGAAIMLVGALCYAELASAWPDAGGEYHFLHRAYGPGTAFLFAWSRLAVVQTGAIAMVAFVLGDYAQRLLDLGPYGASVYAGLAVAAMAGINISGTRLSARVQNLLAALLVTAAVVAAGLGFLLTPDGAAASGPPPAEAGLASAAGFAMIFIMLTYGGWNEAAYLSAELKDVRRNMVRVVALATFAITAIYLALNGAYLKVLGTGGVRASEAVGADYMQALLGAPGALVLSGVIVVAALTTLNATVFTGARSIYAMSRDFAPFSMLGRWDARAQGPVAAHLIQAVLALALVAFGTATRQGFKTMVDYTAPVFWFFLTLTALSVIVLRRRGGAAGAFRVPFYPLTPILFCGASAYMLHSAVVYTGKGALAGIGILALGMPLWWLARRRLAQMAA